MKELSKVVEELLTNWRPIKSISESGTKLQIVGVQVLQEARTPRTGIGKLSRRNPEAPSTLDHP